MLPRPLKIFSAIQSQQNFQWDLHVNIVFYNGNLYQVKNKICLFIVNSDLHVFVVLELL